MAGVQTLVCLQALWIFMASKLGNNKCQETRFLANCQWSWASLSCEDHCRVQLPLIKQLISRLPFLQFPLLNAAMLRIFCHSVWLRGACVVGICCWHILLAPCDPKMKFSLWVRANVHISGNKKHVTQDLMIIKRCNLEYFFMKVVACTCYMHVTVQDQSCMFIKTLRATHYCVS